MTDYTQVHFKELYAIEDYIDEFYKKFTSILCDKYGYSLLIDEYDEDYDENCTKLERISSEDRKELQILEELMGGLLKAREAMMKTAKYADEDDFYANIAYDFII